MRWSKCFIPTLRESPAGVETAAERLLLRAGYVRAESAGVYGYLPLGMRSMRRLQAMAREELSALNGQEILLNTAAATAVARGELRSTKQLPQLWYRIETPLLRMRQLVGLDVYGFGGEPQTIATMVRRIVERASVNCTWSAGGAIALLPNAPDVAAVCPGCGFAAALDGVQSVPAPAPPDLPATSRPNRFTPPGRRPSLISRVLPDNPSRCR